MVTLPNFKSEIEPPSHPAGVPTLPWSGDGVHVDYASCPGGVFPEDIYDKACIHSLEEALDCCNRLLIFLIVLFAVLKRCRVYMWAYCA